ncbi:MAG: hypothetical protein K2W85_14575 [Phycisphaerales bacterium]|nr:hypothetical protein [Phycisphaerales bacterium]
MAKQSKSRRGAASKSPSSPAGAELQLATNPQLPTVSIDDVRVALRSDTPLMILSFFQGIPGTEPDMRFEVFRGIVTVDHAKKIVDVLAKQLNHYPVKDSADNL